MKKRNTILVVDDLEMNRAILSNIFKKKYNIAEAIDGDEAIEYVRNNSNSIVAILLDLVMPNVSGIEVLKDDKNLLEMLNKVANIHSKMEESEIDSIKELAQKFLSKFEENR